MIQIRLIGTSEEIEECLKRLKKNYDIRHSGIRRARKDKQYLCSLKAKSRQAG